MTDDKPTRNLWVLGLQYLIDEYAKRQRDIIRDNKLDNLFSIFIFLSWILSYLQFADKDNLHTMNKLECQRLLMDSLNVELEERIFEKLFQVKSIQSFAFLLSWTM
jgi:hypothetical protein